jgi:hypothetical protein
MTIFIVIRISFVFVFVIRVFENFILFYLLLFSLVGFSSTVTNRLSRLDHFIRIATLLFRWLMVKIPLIRVNLLFSDDACC